MYTFTFYGADHKVGVSMISKCVAERICLQQRELKILLLHLDGNWGMEYSKITGSGLDDIKAALFSGVFNQKDLMEACSIKNNLYELMGTTSCVSRNEYLPEHVKKILDAAKSIFDICIIDAGSNFNLGLSIGSILHSDNRYLVTTQQAAALRNYLSVKEEILSQMEVTFNALIINKHLEGVRMPESSYEPMNLPIFFVEMSAYGWQAEKERESLLDYDLSFKKQIVKLSLHMLRQCGGIGELESEAERGFLKKFSVLKGGRSSEERV